MSEEKILAVPQKRPPPPQVRLPSPFFVTTFHPQTPLSPSPLHPRSMETDASNANPNHTNPSNSKPMSALHFLRALAHIKRTTPKSSLLRSRRIRHAAYASMAYTAGPGRLWSRALLRKLRRRSRLRHSSSQRTRIVIAPKRLKVVRPRTGEPSRAEALRRLVPGGGGMDYCSLLDETANYIQCLSSQVQVMQKVADSIFF